MFNQVPRYRRPRSRLLLCIVLLVMMFVSPLGQRSSTFAQQPTVSPVDKTSTETPLVTEQPINILLMGVDARDGDSIDTGSRPDALAVLHLDPDSGACRMLSIPRDTRVELPGYGLSKINHALMVGGIPFEQTVVSQFLGIDIDHYALIDFSGVTDLVDAVGGVVIDVTEPFAIDSYYFSPGEQQLDGAAALAYSRYRGGPDGDFGRQKRQQQILRALMAQTATADVKTLITQVLPIAQNHFLTDFTPFDLLALATTYRSTCTEKTVTMLRFTGAIATFDDPIAQMPLSYVVIDEAEVQAKVNELINGE